ncbi:fibronectin type III domain-containing protein [Lentzea sp. DG1S-22]|uniref:fibronectin type III domain-containing protein n=1 Tax=Lentzea sp. DG1S-22 TaxID=3108822 RepID=UPI002E761B35|nr:fibronectin type III domain-containing protein [Lentzea sp. DG1S-22]WVH78710.1 fibronectin type III domain-containing protein [Lentzea sp. DG1S-22]
MDRRTLAGGLGGLALVVAAVVALRTGDAPGTLEREIADGVEVVAPQEPVKPANPRTQALDVDALQVAWNGSASAYEVRWNGNVQLVPTPEVELPGLDPDAETSVEVRAVSATGRRSEPLLISATPEDLYDDRWDDRLVGQVDRFDGPEALDPRKWRVLAEPECLGLRPFGQARRIDVDCPTAAFQSNTPLRFGMPAADGATGRAVVSVAGAVESSHVRLTLLPDPWQYLEETDAQPKGSVSLDVTTQGTRIIADPDLSRTGRQITLGDSQTTGLVAGVRHRWEMRVLPDAVVALRDGVVVAYEPVAITERLVHPRIRIDGGGFLDAFGVGGVPERVVPTEVIPLEKDVELPQDAVAAKLVSPVPGRQVTVSDLPLTTGKVAAAQQARLVVIRKPESRPQALPRLSDRPGGMKTGAPRLHVVHEDGTKPPQPLPRKGRVLVTAEVNAIGHRGVELELDGKRIAALPTDEQGSAVPGRHEFWLDTAALGVGASARLELGVLPADGGEPVIAETVFALG